MEALFADLSERTRQRYQQYRAFKADERRHTMALFDAVQVAIANGEHDRVTRLLREMRLMVNASIARRKGSRGQ